MTAKLAYEAIRLRADQAISEMYNRQRTLAEGSTRETTTRATRETNRYRSKIWSYVIRSQEVSLFSYIGHDETK